MPADRLCDLTGRAREGDNGLVTSRPRLLAALVVAGWLIVGIPMWYFAANLSSIQQNDNAAYLPGGAESTKVLSALSRFQDAEAVPTVVVFHRRGGLTKADRAAIDGYAARIGDLPGIGADRVGAPVPSQDGAASQIVIQVDSAQAESLTAGVSRIREVIADPPAGLAAHVGGPGGVLGDFIVAFDAIDGILLLVALGVVLVILVLVYRSPVLPVVVLLCAVLSLGVASAVVYALAKAELITVNGQSQGILFILAVGAATDYSLLLVARYREELRDTESPVAAMRTAYRTSAEPILASGMTVILGLLCLLLSDLASISGLGPVGALGVAGAMLSSLTLLPAALLLLGRRVFWPFPPTLGSPHRDTSGLWGRLARLIGHHARAVWVTTFVVLATFGAFMVTLDEHQVPQTEAFLTEVDSVVAQRLLDAHYAADDTGPAQLLVPEAELTAALTLVAEHPGVARPDPLNPVPPVFAIPSEEIPDSPGQPPAWPVPKIVDGNAVIVATLADPADSAAASRTIQSLRRDLDELDPSILVGGPTAINLDIRTTTSRDRNLVMPVILAVIMLVLILLLRSLVAPALLLVANVLSFAATMGISSLMFQHVFDFPSTEPTIMLIAFVFLVALGIDYSIFLMTRVREESIRQGTHPGVLKGLSVTGGVITSAGVVLAATFAALGVIPLLFLAQIGFIVAFGVLLDALIVRSLLVPALCYDVGPRIWWPGPLARERDHPDPETAAMLG